jgi:2OG-Fe(II) oxygenase superfamily
MQVRPECAPTCATGAAGPPVRYWEQLIEEADEMFRHLVASIAWDHSMRARLTASCGLPYDYAGISYVQAPMPPALQEVIRLLRLRLPGFAPNNCLLNYYLDGHSKMGFHADSIDELEGDTGVAIVTLGCPRPLRFRRQDDPEVRWEMVPAAGSLLYLPQQVHREWVHAILRQKQAGPRISLTFRQLKAR